MDERVVRIGKAHRGIRVEGGDSTLIESSRLMEHVNMKAKKTNRNNLDSKHTVIPKALHTVRIIEAIAYELMEMKGHQPGDVKASELVLEAARICGYPDATKKDPIVARVIETLNAITESVIGKK